MSVYRRHTARNAFVNRKSGLGIKVVSILASANRVGKTEAAGPWTAAPVSACGQVQFS